MVRKLNDVQRHELVMNSIEYYKLFFKILQKHSYPQELYEEAKVDMATMGERLSNLLQVKLIKKEDRQGRKQFYEVDWDHFFLVFYAEQEIFMIDKVFFPLSVEEIKKHPEFIERDKKLMLFILKYKKNISDLLQLGAETLTYPRSLRKFITEDFYKSFLMMDFALKNKGAWSSKKQTSDLKNIKSFTQEYLSLFEPIIIDKNNEYINHLKKTFSKKSNPSCPARK